MLSDTFVEQVVEFSQDYAIMEDIYILDNLSIIAFTELEDEGIKDRIVANHFGTYQYIIHCAN